MKKLTALFGSCLFFFLVMTMYLLLDQFSMNLDKESFVRETEKAAKSVKHIKDEIDRLETGLDFSNRIIDTMNEKVDDLSRQTKTEKQELDLDKPIKFVPKAVEEDTQGNGKEMCHFTSTPALQPNIKMLDVFDEIKFDNVDGGVWKQGWDITYENSQFDKKKLLVFVVPHSHNDPGWIKTVDQYFREQTIKILDNVIDGLAKNEKRKFIWAETSYFSMWWAEASPGKKQMAQEQIRNGQLEIVTGGWVMNDEANPHYFNMLDQMVEGHQWLENHIGVKPKYGWAIDPFGYTSTMPYLLKRMGFEGMLIQRVHYNVKKHLASRQNLEFMWRQNWGRDTSTDIFTHVMPFYSYDIPHTCGPDPKVCCQFDFARLSGGGLYCPWHVPPQEIHDGNIAERSKLLLDQYKKKAQLYKSNIVLAPLGDDFRYQKLFEVNAQFNNYDKIMEYVNSHPELNTEIKYGTLKDYFNAVANREGVAHGTQPPGFPSLGGDFFTYADRDDHYWSGYYTSRSFFKHMDRELACYLRAAEIMYSLAVSHGRHHGKFPSDVLYPKLLSSRKELALFQHHDGVTGTAKDHVVTDYGQRMYRAILDSISIMETSTNYLLSTKKDDFQENISGVPVLKFSESRSAYDAIPTKDLIIVPNTPRAVVFYNSLAQERKQTVFLYIDTPFVQVVDTNDDIIPHQVSLLWKTQREVQRNKYKLSFVVVLPALGLRRYKIKHVVSDDYKSLAHTKIYHAVVTSEANKHFNVTNGNEQQIKVNNKHLLAMFDADSGLLTDLKCGGKSHVMQIRFMKYGTVANMDRSGAYLFLPDGEAVSVATNNPPVIVTSGKIYTEVLSYLQYVIHRVRIYHGDVPEAKSLDIQNTLDIRHTNNFELVMRIESSVKNVDREFFTDLNGFQMQRRKTLAKLPLQANFYPVPTMAFLQDKFSRLTLQMQQANGVASLEKGYLEVVLDRRLMQDDNRGLGQGVTDNKVTLSNFRLLLECFNKDNVQADPIPPVAYPSTLSISLTHQLQHPVFTFAMPSTINVNKYLPFAAGLKKPLPCDLHIVNLKTLQDNIKPLPSVLTALFLHRIGYDCNFPGLCSEKRLTYQDIFEPLSVNDLEQTSLSLMHSKKKLNADTRIQVSPMEIQAYKLKLS